MDLLQRLIAGSGSASSKQHQLPTPTERLSSCKKLCNALQSAWRSSSTLSSDDASTIQVTNVVRRLNTILEDESRKAAPHSCLLYAASNQIYIIIAKLALCSTSHDLISTATQFFHFLINGEVEGILDNKIFARSLIDLVKRCIAPATKVVNEQEECALIELLFEICTKIRLDPVILPAWFYPERDPGQKSVSPTDVRRGQFPLFYLLVDYVHYDGSIGDFARMALLYLTETAPRSLPLEKWMMESDLAHQMASGLSALYGRLSRQAPTINKSALPILAFSDVFEKSGSAHVSDEESSQNMRACLAYLQFWQDALSRCQSSEVRDTLLDSFQLLFVEQLLYPSLLESSDVEGGSTSAVILHLCSLLEALEHPQLIDRMLSYLFATKSQPTLTNSRHGRQRMSISRRKSMEQLASLAQLADNPSPDLFSLLDLLIFSLRSNQPQTVTASLRLITILLQRHHPYVRQRLFELEAMPSNGRQNLNSLNNTMMTFFDLAGAISQVNSIDQSYQAALQDAQSGMERHSCLLEESLRTSPDLATWVVSANCKVMDQMIASLRTWFTNDTLVNLELSGAFTSLSTCEYVLMRSWLVPSGTTLEGNAVERYCVITVISQLVQQVTQWRSQFVEWDAFYSIQKVEIAGGNELSSLGQRNLSPLGAASLSSNEGIPASRPSPIGASSKRAGSSDLVSIDANLGARKGSTPGGHRQPLRNGEIRDAQVEATSTRSVSSTTLSATLLETRIPIQLPSHQKRRNKFGSEQNESVVADDNTNDEDIKEHAIQEGDETEGGDGEENTEERSTASLRHLLTQAIILQEFILELAAALQIRATLFDEVDLS